MWPEKTSTTYPFVLIKELELEQGPFCQQLEGGSFLIGNQKPRDEKPVHVVYLYPDLTHAIGGLFEMRPKGILAMVEGHFGEVSGVDWSTGFPIPRVQFTSDQVFKYDPSTGLRISRNSKAVGAI